MGNKLYWKGLLHDKGMVGVWENRYDFEKEENHISITVSRRLKYIDVTIIAEIKTNLVEILFSVLRFENLFLGHFYKTETLVIDEDEALETIDDILPFYQSTVKWLLMPNFTMNRDMNVEFSNWLDLDRKLGIIHNMFLYAAYAKDLTNDVKLALILQTFEPISEDLSKQGKITITPHNHKNAKDSRIIFGDRVFAIMNCYGNDIFQEDNIDGVIEKSVNLRDKVVHLDRSIIETLNGKQATYYLQKFVMLYIIVILTELGIDYNQLQLEILKALDKWKCNFPELHAMRIQ